MLKPCTTSSYIFNYDNYCEFGLKIKPIKLCCVEQWEVVTNIKVTTSNNNNNQPRSNLGIK